MVNLEQGREPIPGYYLVKELGEGSFGVVWLAEGPGKTRVALKFLGLHRAAGMKEYRAISWIKKIQHPNLLPVIGLWLLNQRGDVMDRAAIDQLMEHVNQPGTNQLGTNQSGAERPTTVVVGMVAAEKSLNDVLEQHQSQGQQGIPVDELLRYIEDSARGLDFLNAPRHELGDGQLASVQHRDIKPENILLLGDVAVICDFGVARAFHSESITATGMIGSPAFIAPECIDGKVSSRTSDQYSLALTYYYLRTGRHGVPSASTPLMAINCHLTGELDLSFVGQAERAVLRRATAMEAQHRYDSCGDFVRAMRQAVSEPPKHHLSADIRDTVPSQARATNIVPDRNTRATSRFADTTRHDPNFSKAESAKRTVVVDTMSIPTGIHVGTWEPKPRKTGLLILSSFVWIAIVAALVLVIQFLMTGPDSNSVKKTATLTKSDVGIDAEDEKVGDRVEKLKVSQPLNHESSMQDVPTIEAVEQAFSPSGQAPPSGRAPNAKAASGQASLSPHSAPVKSVDLDVEDVKLPVPSQAEKAARAFEQIGGIFNQDYTTLDLSGKLVDDELLESLQSFPDLVELTLTDTAIGDSGLAVIATHNVKLQRLFLSGTKVTDGGLRHLARFSKIAVLDLAKCDIHDFGLRALQTLQSLEGVGLDSTRVTDEGLYELSRALNDDVVIQGPRFTLQNGKPINLGDLP